MVQTLEELPWELRLGNRQLPVDVSADRPDRSPSVTGV